MVFECLELTCNLCLILYYTTIQKGTLSTFEHFFALIFWSNLFARNTVTQYMGDLVLSLKTARL